MDTALALDTAACDRARLARDARFDGVFFTAVRSTGIYCRPVCPAPPPKPRNITYYPTAAAAAAAGYRPCLRCRPELAPQAQQALAGQTVQRALALIHGGFLQEQPVADLATKLGLSARALTAQEAAELKLRGGIVVEGADGAAARAGLQRGDVILKFGDVTINEFVFFAFRANLSRVFRSVP